MVACDTPKHISESSIDLAMNDGPVAVGRIKSFSQKSGWGFIQLFDKELDDHEHSRDVFFHRADVTRSGSCELRPGILVHCGVVCTGKGEKASNIIVVDEDGSEQPSAESALTSPVIVMCVGSADDSLTHSPYGSTVSSTMSPLSPVPSSPSESLYSLRCTNNVTAWQCAECTLQNVVRSIRRVTVACAACGAMHQVDSWICACSHPNGRGSRQCAACHAPYAHGCQRLAVRAGIAELQLAAQSAEPAAPAPLPVPGPKRAARTRWSRSGSGWVHPGVDAPEASTWCQENFMEAGADCHRGETRQEHLVEKCRGRLLWARDWLLQGAGSPVGDNVADPQWLGWFATEVTHPKHRLLCPARGQAAFVPNPCVDLEDVNVMMMYEAIGMALALAAAIKTALPATLPGWMARSLLGFPTSMQDLQEFDLQLWLRADGVQRHPHVETLGLTFREPVKRYGVVRHFGDGAAVTAATQPTYGAWLKDVYLAKAVEQPLKQLKHGFFYALMGDRLLQGLTPAQLGDILRGGAAVAV